MFRAALIFAFALTSLASEPGLAIRFSSLLTNSANTQHSAPVREAHKLSTVLARTQHLAAPSALKIIPFPALHLPSNQPPAFGLDPGPFTAEITGFISVDLRAQHTFTAELTGKIELLINGKELLNSALSETETNLTSLPIRLSKGTNALLIRYTSPTNAPATLRLLWSSRNTAVPIPIPAAGLSHSSTPELAQSLSLHNGAYLYAQYQCARCHAPEQRSNFPFDAPDLIGIGSRLNPDWIASWVQNPSHARPARMPALFHGPDAPEKSRAVASYLATLTTENSGFGPTPELQKTGATLVDDLRCRSCHTFPTEPASPDRISLKHVPEKFIPGALVAYLEKPQAHYPGNPMPNFKMSSAEAQSVAAFLLAHEPTHRSKSAAASAALGKDLVQKSGCLNCHSSDLPNLFSAPRFEKLSNGGKAHGCLAEEPSNAPRFSFSSSERADLITFLTSGIKANLSPSPAEFALRSTDFLRCNQCHVDSTLPAPLALGGKLKPEWTAGFISGKNLQKPRPWLKTRMPAFPAYATNLAAGLAALHGYPPHTPAETLPPSDLVKIGGTLVGSTGGFSCVACHAVGASSVQLVVESPGINLAFSSARLLPKFFHRWLMNPIAIDPSTKMPAYFDAEGRSQLTEFFDGDAHQQVQAMWHYIRSVGEPK